MLAKHGTGVDIWASDYERLAQYNRQLVAPSIMPNEREKVFSLYRNGYSEIEKWYKQKMTKLRIKRRIRSNIPTSVKKVIKQFGTKQ